MDYSLEGTILSFNYIFPDSINSIIFGHHSNQCVINAHLPNGLKTISFIFYSNQSVMSANLPDRLTTISFGFCFNQPIINANLPNSIKTITFGCEFNHSIISANLPKNLYYTYDYSNKIEFHESLKTLHSIDYFTRIKTVKYKRHVGMHTKSATLNKL
jgi:hypothetical protein